MTLQKRSELNFFCLLLQVLVRRKAVAELVSHPVFLDRGQRICFYLARGTSYETEELFQDLCLKLLTTGAMPRAEQTPNEDAYFRWLFVLVLNMRNDYFRRNGKRRQEVSLSEIMLGALAVADPGGGPELECCFAEFAEFAENAPKEIRRIIELRRDGFTYEAIAKKLSSPGVKYTDVTVRKRFRDSLKAFFDCGEKGAASKTVRKVV